MPVFIDRVVEVPVERIIEEEIEIIEEIEVPYEKTIIREV